MHIHNLIAKALATAAAMTGCTTAQNYPAPSELKARSSATTTPVKAIDFSCDPRIAANWLEGHEPDDVKATRLKGWVIAKLPYNDVIITYFRDCSVSVRGPISETYEHGPLLSHSYCRGDKLSGSIFGESIPDETITISMIVNASEALRKLRETDVCASKMFTSIA